MNRPHTETEAIINDACQHLWRDCREVRATFHSITPRSMVSLTREICSLTKLYNCHLEEKIIKKWKRVVVESPSFVYS